ncbi:MAG: F0F1 ATP synthase subunit gamma [Elainellaceae cyanobacterium]
MPTLDAPQRKIQSVEDLQSIVKTMKALAGANIRQYENAVASLAEHSRVLNLALQILMINATEAIAPLPTPPRRLGIVAFGSDQGMCGQFNENLADFIVNRLGRQDVPPAALITVGSRLTDRLTAMGQSTTHCFPVPSSLNGVTPLVQKLVLQLEAWETKGHVDHIWGIYNRTGSTTSPHPVLKQLFPLSTLYLQKLAQCPWPSRCRPQLLTGSRHLFSAMFQQHFFIGLYRACAESLASENASRLASMQTAEKNIEERLFGLKAAFQRQRQDHITEELLDIIAGFEALT